MSNILGAVKYLCLTHLYDFGRVKYFGRVISRVWVRRARELFWVRRLVGATILFWAREARQFSDYSSLYSTRHLGDFISLEATDLKRTLFYSAIKSGLKIPEKKIHFPFVRSSNSYTFFIYYHFNMISFI